MPSKKNESAPAAPVAAPAKVKDTSNKEPFRSILANQSFLTKGPIGLVVARSGEDTIQFKEGQYHATVGGVVTVTPAALGNYAKPMKGNWRWCVTEKQRTPKAEKATNGQTEANAAEKPKAEKMTK